MLLSVTRAALLLALSATPLFAQHAATAPASDATELIRLENAWTTGLVHRDRALFDKLLGPKFVYTENDKLMRRDAVLNDVATSTDTVTAARNEGMEVHQFSPTTAAVTGWLIVQGRSAGKRFTHRYRFTDTWLKSEAGWKIVAAQDYLAPK